MQNVIPIATISIAKDEAERNDLAHHFTEEEECEEEVDAVVSAASCQFAIRDQRCV